MFIHFIHIFEASNAHAKPRKVFFVNVLCFFVYFVFIIFKKKLVYSPREKHFHTFDALYINVHAQCIILFMQKAEES